MTSVDVILADPYLVTDGHVYDTTPIHLQGDTIRSNLCPRRSPGILSQLSFLPGIPGLFISFRCQTVLNVVEMYKSLERN